MQEQFAQKMIEILNLFTETQSENMKTVADIIVDRIKEGGRFFVFGTGHSHMVVLCESRGACLCSTYCSNGIDVRRTPIKVNSN